jgi:hypothetical protein
LSIGLVASALLVLLAPPRLAAQPSGSFTLSKAVQRAIAANPKLAAADTEIAIAAGKRIQAVIPAHRGQCSGDRGQFLTTVQA